MRTLNAYQQNCIVCICNVIQFARVLNSNFETSMIGIVRQCACDPLRAPQNPILNRDMVSIPESSPRIIEPILCSDKVR